MQERRCCKVSGLWLTSIASVFLLVVLFVFAVRFGSAPIEHVLEDIAGVKESIARSQVGILMAARSRTPESSRIAVRSAELRASIEHLMEYKHLFFSDSDAFQEKVRALSRAAETWADKVSKALKWIDKRNEAYKRASNAIQEIIEQHVTSPVPEKAQRFVELAQNYYLRHSLTPGILSGLVSQDLGLEQRLRTQEAELGPGLVAPGRTLIRSIESADTLSAALEAWVDDDFGAKELSQRMEQLRTYLLKLNHQQLVMATYFRWGFFLAAMALAVGAFYLVYYLRRKALEMARVNEDLASEITEREKAERLLNIQRDVLESVVDGQCVQRILDKLCTDTEALVPGAVCSVMAQNGEGTSMQVLAAPSLTRDIIDCFEGLPIAEGQGSCATAMVRGQPVYVGDAFDDPVWENVRGTAKAIGIRSCWSQPVLVPDDESPGRKVSFAITRMEPGQPDIYCRHLLEMGARLAGIVLRRSRDQERIEHLATHDELTGLPNRLLLQDRLEQALAQAHRTTSLGALLFLDLDHFKVVNDSLGHAVGDKLLVEVAVRLRDALREVDTVARLGGDEFVMVMTGLGDDREKAVLHVQALVKKLQRILSSPLSVDGHSMHVRVSVGVVMFPEEGETADDLLRQADTAMYRAKAEGRDRVRLYLPSMAEAARERLALEHDLRTALASNQFTLYYQPQVDHEGRIIGAEALLRWRHPQKGLIAPASFIAILEETGLIIDVGHWVLAKACDQLRAWQQRDGCFFDLGVSINVSPRQFRQPDFVDRVAEVLDTSGIDARQITLELTEGMALENVEGVIDKMQSLKALGVKIAMDDFGTGYSSLTYLKRMPVDTLKIDRSFVMGLPQDADDAAVVRTVIAVARHFSLTLVAEGVEEEQQQHFLYGEGCSCFQGYLFGKPMSAHEFKAHAGGEHETTPVVRKRTGGTAIL